MWQPVAEPASPLIVGTGRVGRAILRAYPHAVPVRRGQSLHDRLLGAAATTAARPIFVATTNDALEQVISDCPPARRCDLVFLQNGMLLPLLQRHGLAVTATQALCYFSAGEDGSIVDGQRTVVYGRWAGALADALHAGGVACRQVDRGEYLAAMVEKLLWASIYWLLSAGLGGLPVGVLAQQHGDAAEELAAELLPLAQVYLLQRGAAPGEEAELATAGDSLEQVATLTVPGVCRSMAEYSLSIPAAVPSRSMALAEFEWRNGWFWRQARTPEHAAWLERAGVELPEALRCWRGSAVLA